MSEHRTYRTTGELETIVIDGAPTPEPIEDDPTARHPNQAPLSAGETGSAEALAAAAPLFDALTERQKHVAGRFRPEPPAEKE